MSDRSTYTLSRIDQAKAHADDTVSRMVANVREDLTTGIDTTAAWWAMADGLTALTHQDLAAGFSTTLLKLAQQQHTTGHRCCIRRVVHQGRYVWRVHCHRQCGFHIVDSWTDAVDFANRHWNTI